MSEGNNKITIGEVTEQLNTKVDTDLGNLDTTTFPDGIDYVVRWQVPTASNGYTWFRLYKSGWVEQGGVIEYNVSSLSYPIAMIDTNYCLNISFINSGNTGTSQWQQLGANTLSTTGMTFSTFTTVLRRWQVSGIAAK